MGSLRRLGRRAGVFWDVDGTLSDSSSLGLQATNAVLAGHALQPVTLAQYHAGTKFPTAERFSWHLSGAFSDPMGARLGRQFDDLHLDMVNEQTTGFYPGITEMLLEVVEEARGEVVYAALSNGAHTVGRSWHQPSPQSWTPRGNSRRQYWGTLIICTEKTHDSCRNRVEKSGLAFPSRKFRFKNVPRNT